MDTLRVAANGILFEVAAAGSGDRLALCLHGFPETAYCWRHQMPLLARLGYRVWAPNLRGYGGTDSPREVAAYRFEVLVEDVACLIQAAGARQTLLMGHDWGGALAWALAMRRPALLDRLVILNMPHPACFRREFRRPAQFAKSWYMLLFQLPILPELLLRRRIGELFRRTSSGFPAEAIELYRQNAARPGGATAMLNWYRALLRGGGLRRLGETFPKIETPTLFLWGDADAALSIRTTVGTADFVADLTFRVLPGVSHWIQEEAADQVNASLEAWLTSRGEI